MKKKTFQIDIPEPCNESWDKMTPQEKGRFCGNCEKTIIDYSLQPDRVIAQAIKEGNGQICGRFRTDQLQRDIVFEPVFYQNTRWKAFGLMLSGLLAAGALKGQDVSNSSPVINFEQQKQVSDLTSNGLILSGRVINKITGTGLIGASIVLKDHKLETTTNLEGYFELEVISENIKSKILNHGFFLEIDYIDYQNEFISITEESLQTQLRDKYDYIKLDSLDDLYTPSISIPIIELIKGEKVVFCFNKEGLTDENIITLAGGEEVRRGEGMILGVVDGKYNHSNNFGLKYLFYKIVSSFYKNEKNIPFKENERTPETPYFAIEPSSLSIPKAKQPQDKELPFLPKIIQKTYPNPFIDKLNIEIKVEQAETYDLVLFNELGQEIHRKTVAAISGINQFTLHLNEKKLATGTYLLSILNEKDVIQTEIVIKK